jgi:hypothetical protein
MRCPPQLPAFIAAKLFCLAVRILRNFSMALQTVQDFSAGWIAGVDAVPLAVGFDCIFRNAKLRRNCGDWNAGFTHGNQCVFLFVCHFIHLRKKAGDIAPLPMRR